MNMLHHTLMFAIGQLQAGDYTFLDEFNLVKSEINKHFAITAMETVEKSYTKSVDESEIVNIFHHENHKKKMKQSSIVKLETEDKGTLHKLSQKPCC